MGKLKYYLAYAKDVFKESISSVLVKIFGNILFYVSNFIKEYGLIIVMLTIGFVVTKYTFLYAIEFSSFAVGVLKYGITIWAFHLFDKYYLTEIDTVDMIKGDPIAYSIFILANAVMVSVCIATS